jgi:hypothetical protein
LKILWVPPIGIVRIRQNKQSKSKFTSAICRVILAARRLAAAVIVPVSGTTLSFRTRLFCWVRLRFAPSGVILLSSTSIVTFKVTVMSEKQGRIRLSVWITSLGGGTFTASVVKLRAAMTTRLVYIRKR